MRLSDELFMRRCFELARLGAGSTAPNPMVGAVICHQGRILGEGYHQAYGQAHAEVNAVRSVSPADRALLPASTLYVSLEPCNIYGNTPPCTDLVLKEGFSRVVVSSTDLTPGVQGSGLERLRAAGVEVVTGVLAQEGQRLSAARNTFVALQRPYVLLKYAQSADGFLAPLPKRQQWLSGPLAKRLVHKWRSEHPAIWVGAQTARTDNPRLNNRFYYGPSPVRVVYDRDLSLPQELNIFDGSSRTLLFTHAAENIEWRGRSTGVEVIRLEEGAGYAPQVLRRLAEAKISSVMVEGGAALLAELLGLGLWDEALALSSQENYLGQGLKAPEIGTAPAFEAQLGPDHIAQYFRP
ncbi:bifunctional diaminohydroxyphosphoribosylaminopyrimidine deaminase/5-amino-6-(5-phosphoribosylamino)uracil reductase RibD [Phaeodactylibacter luteus]|uniref:Riboflavin biosynthesis protein RibD n=1 Tax=Phaeodactylibacter luteus TaxID=1564516 RepID=A0A5C6S6N0_9BACT|nr:bifunctional diaminohydroxyphosphoribosylaminopyrimidine deaminase/5-amino-6-(5-phosphoribosylamino)uracil reductase RibD [Phaeodactylibacter luteus]TXB69472.1 bifunctional diaminohydroxyphosphoribosylaminopyrimidine deaminase/5-amino-6-(5-phosphoribosylamino)uracil reductase RibD [Phaeodactylibacter luteus]